MRRKLGFWAVTLWLCPLALAAQDVRLNLSGGDSDLRRSLRAASLTLSLERDGATAAQDYVAAARADYRRLLTGLYAEGYYGGEISILVDGTQAALIDPLQPRTSVSSVVINVTAGPRFAFGRADIAPLPSGTQMPEAFAVGQIARASAVGDATSVAVDAWRGQGRPLAAPAGQTITARHPDRQLDASVTIDPGPQLRFGRIEVEGNSAVRSERVIAIAGIPSKRFDPFYIERAETNLRRAGAFSSAAIIEGEAAEGDTLPLTLSVVEQRPRRIGAGVELSSASGLTLSGFWLHRNLLGGAERLRVDGKVEGLAGGNGGINYTLGASYLRPATFRQDTDFYVNARLEQLDEPAFFQRTGAVESGIIRRINDDIVLQFGLGYEVGRVSDALGDRDYSLASLPLQGTIDRRDNTLNATAGYFANLQIMPFAGQGSTGSGLRAAGDARAYRSFGEDDRVTFAVRGQFGAVLGADAASIPANYLFYSGGGGTVRGQPFQSLGVDLGGGNTIGGSTFIGGQIEARVGVTDAISAVGFYDAGFVAADELAFLDGDWHAGAGLGLRYDTGIGPIRLDVAVPTTGSKAGERVEVYIGIGQAF